MTAPTTTPGLSDEQLVELLALLKGSKSVELKLTVPDTAQRAAIAQLGIDPLGAQIRQVFFFDTPELALNQSGIVVRARRVQTRDGDTVVKLRPVVPDDLPDELRQSPNLGIEVDAMPGGFVCSASLKGVADNAAVREVALGTRALKKVLTKEQRAFYAAHAPDGVQLEDLSLLGPIFILKLNFRHEDFDRKLVAELWLYPDGSRIFELSTKGLPSEAFQVATEARAFFTARGISLSGEQQTKTKSALEFFAQELKQ